VLLDILLNGEDGFDICREIRHTWSQEELPVIMITVMEDVEPIKKAYESGANDFLTKPLHWPHLPYRIWQVLRTNRDIAERKKVELALRKSHELLSLFIRDSPIYTYIKEVTSTKSRVLEASDNFRQMIGIPGSEMVGKTMEELYPAEMAKKFSAEDWAVASAGKVLELAEEFNGRSYTTVKFPIIQGEKNLLAGFTTDISERKKAEEALLKSERFLREAQAAGGVGCFSLDVNFGIWESSATFDDIFGIGPDYPRDMVGWLELISADVRETHQQQMLELVQGIGQFNMEFRIQRGKDSQERWVSGQGSLEFDSQGQTTRLVGTMLDITERKLAEAEILQLNQYLEQRVKERTAQLEFANKEMEAFSYSVSHDLRAPLRSIDGFSQVLLEDYSNQVDEAGKEYLTRIRQGAHRMGRLIDDLLKLSKTSRSELTLSNCDLSLLCCRAANDLALANPEHRIKVFIQPAMLVQADHHLIQVAIENLLGNAWKFTSKSEDPKVEVGETVSPEGGRIFFIRDNGAGFDMAFAGKLFNAFQRLHPVTEFEGTGIGLAIVQRIIHRHGGRIWAEAEPGKGATFFFTIPAMGQS